jgi:hypothetical protein
MRHRPRAVRPSLLALSMGLLTAAVPPSQAGPPASIAGLWKLNVEQSERLEDRMRGGRDREGGEEGFPGGGYPRGGPRGGGGRGPRAAHPLLQVLIEATDSTVSISDAGGQMQAFRIDGHKIKETQLDGSELETTAKWKDGKLTIERKLQDAGTIKQSYWIDPVSRKLMLTVHLSGSRLPRAIDIRRVYDPATGGT